MEMEKVHQAETLPCMGANQGNQAGETVIPLRLIGLESSEQPDQQGGPDLPLNGAFAVADESGEFEGLLDMFEENLLPILHPFH